MKKRGPCAPPQTQSGYNQPPQISKTHRETHNHLTAHPVQIQANLTHLSVKNMQYTRVCGCVCGGANEPEPQSPPAHSQVEPQGGGFGVLCQDDLIIRMTLFCPLLFGNEYGSWMENFWKHTQ